MHRPYGSARSDRGASLISVLIGIGVMSVLVLVMSQMMGNTLKATKDLEVKGEYEDLRLYVQYTYSCYQTIRMKPGACQNPATQRFLDILANKGSAVAPVIGDVSAGQNYTIVSKRYLLRASCPVDAKTGKPALLIEAARLPKAATKAIAASTGDDKSYAWQDLFRKVPLGCEVY